MKDLVKSEIILPEERDELTVSYTGSPFGAYRNDVHRTARPEGMSIEEIVRSIPNLPRWFDTHGVVCINGRPIPRDQWWRRPRVKSGVPTTIQLFVSPGRGGREGGGGSGRILLIIAAIALLALTSWIAAGGIAALSGAGAAGLFAANTFASRLLAAGVGIIGGLVLKALSPPPTEAGLAEINQAGIGGNVLAKGAVIPSVIGTFRVFPALICFPRVLIEGDDEVATAVFALAGRHLITDILIDGTPIVDAEDVEYEVLDGDLADTTDLTLVTEQSFTAVPAIRLSQHKWGDSQQVDHWLVEDQTTPTNSIPIWHGFVSRNAPDRIELHLEFPSGLSSGGATGRVAFRIRARLKGEASWRNLPEIHITGNVASGIRKMIVLTWLAIATTPPTVTGSGPRPRTAYVETVAQTSPSSPAFAADSYFDDGAGDRYLDSSNEASTRLRNIGMFDDRVELYLDDTWARGVYEFEIKRSAVMDETLFGESGYTYNGIVNDPFYYKTDAGNDIAIRESDDDVCDILLTRVVSVWDELPVQAGSGLALIAVRARNRVINQLSCLATRYTYAPGSDDDWTALGTSESSNPAVALRQVWLGSVGNLNRKPLVAAQLDEQSLLDWYDFCVLNDLRVDMVVTGETIAQIGMIITGCGYARAFKSDLWGVAIDKDRTGEDPAQIFAAHNMRNFRWSKAFHDLPDHLIARFEDEENNYESQEVVIYADGVTPETAVLPEIVDYRGMVRQIAVQIRGLFDLSQGRARATFYTGEAWTESIVCRRGDLVGVQYDILRYQAGSARIKEKLLGTNLMRQSESPNLTPWVARGAVTVTPNQEPPEGYLYASLVENIDNQGVDDLYQLVVAVTGEDYTPSFMIKRVTTSGILGLLNPFSFVQGAWEIDLSLLSDDWELIGPDHPAVTVVNPFVGVGSTCGFHFTAIGGAGPLDFYMTGAQLNPGTTVDYYARTTTVGGEYVVGLELNDKLPLATEGGDFFSYENLFEVEDIFTPSGSTGVAIRLKDGSYITAEVLGETGEASIIFFATPFADPGDDLAADCMVVSGPLGSEYKRLLVLDIEPLDELKARLTFVDEAPELHEQTITFKSFPESNEITPGANGYLLGVSQAAVAGNLAVLIGYSGGDDGLGNDGPEIFRDLEPDGWEQVTVGSDITGNTADYVIWVKILEESDVAPAKYTSCWDGYERGETKTPRQRLILFDTKNVSGFAIEDVEVELTDGDPVSQTITMAGQTPAVIGIAAGGYDGAGTVAFVDPSVLDDTSISGSDLIVGYKLYGFGSTPADLTIDKADQGVVNWLATFRIRVF